MEQPRQNKSLTIALYAVAALLAANLLALLWRGESPALLPSALAQRQAPIAGGGGMFIMPAQLSGNTWGCYLMDIDRGTLCVYQYFPGSRQLQFIAARNFVNDARLREYNTTPTPSEISDLVNKQNESIRGAAPVAPTPEPKKETP